MASETGCGIKNEPGTSAASDESGELRERIRTILWKEAGILRNGRDLARAVEELGALEVQRPEIPSRANLELYNLWRLGQLITRSALAREESRGGHYRSDFPYHDDEKFLKHSLLSKKQKVSFA